ncbi:MAG TPA: hypothetical protein VJ256_05485 [Dehalococcoidia bacterium]|nr:hypothetical protein [Dehalococcoidia bacterium]HLB29461.1 hypothetical protein [Dehalococcoidia bacterium]
MEEFRIYVHAPPVEGQEIELPLQNVSTLEWQTAKVIVAHEADELSDAAKLWIYDAAGKGALLAPEPWFVQIVELEEEEVPEVKVREAKVNLRERRGDLLATLIRMQEEKERQKAEGGK